MNIFLMAVAFVVGAALGSFACCQVWRLRLRDRSKWSHCLSCGARLSWYDNIPIVSWLALRGSCRRCRAKIGCWELVSELVMGVVFAILMWWFLERWDLGVWGSMGDLVGGQAIRYWLMAICLAFLSVGLMIVLIYDARWKEMPTKVLIFCIVCAIMWVILKQWSLFAVGKFSWDELLNLGGALLLIVEFVLLFFVFIATIALVQATRKVPVQYAKRIVGNKQYGGVRQYLPLKVNAAGVMPIIFAQALMLFPLIFGRFDATRGLAAVLGDYNGFWYNFIFAIFVIAFTWFYTSVTINPTMMAEQMKQNGGFIPGVKPGKKTAEYIGSIMDRITLPGSIFIALVAILPAFARILGINNQFASFYGGTSLLILVGVILDTLTQIESHLMNRHYDGLMKTGRLQGRSGM